MALNFIGEIGAYFPDQDVMKIVAIDGDRAFDCLVDRSALDAIGCAASLDQAAMVGLFEMHRIEVEVAAMIKYRRMLTPIPVIRIDADDLRKVVPPTAA
jgi:hypothetical protein